MQALFQNQGCFMYFKDGGFNYLSSEGDSPIKSKEAVLLRCGSYFLDMMQNVELEKVEVIAIHLYPEILKKIYTNELPALIEKQVHHRDSPILIPQDIITKFIESLEFYFQNPSLVSDDLLELKIKELVLLLIQTKNIDSVLELITDLYSPKTINLREVVNKHLFSDLSIEEMAQLSNLSLSSFKREFKKEFNDSPKNYIIHKRLEKARELLKISDMPINEIAYEIGYNDPLYFTRIFKKHEGITPTAFRSKSLD